MNKLYRSRSDRMFLGVCGGLAHFFRIDTTALRLIFVFLWVLTGFIPLLFAYLIGALVIPVEPKGIHNPSKRRLFRSKSDRKMGGVCGGIAHLFGIDSTLIRLFAVFLCFLTGVFPLVIAYLVIWVFLPER